MSVKRKVTKAEFDALSDEMKAHYKVGSGADEYVLDADDAAGLQATVLRHKQEADEAKRLQAETARQLTELKDKFDAAEAAKAKAEEDRAKSTGDVAALTAQWEKKIADKSKEWDAEKAKLRGQISNLTKHKDAYTLATELAGEDADLILPHILARTETDFDGDIPTTIVLGADGKRSVDKLSDLKAEFLANKKFSRIVIGSKGDGGTGKHGDPKAIGKTDLDDFSKMSDADRTKLWKENPTKFQQLSDAAKQAQRAA